MTTDMTLFKNNPMVSSDLFKKFMDMTSSLAGGSSTTSRRISIKGSRFREMINGEQVRVNSSGSMNVVILANSPIGRTYFEGTYDSKAEKAAPPTCWSQDSEKPAAEVPAAKRKSADCRTCPMNIKGSGQGNSRACRFSVRLAVALEGQYDTVYQLSLPATSLFGEGRDGKLGMQAYAKFMKANETPVIAVVTQMFFDEDSETPKLFFKPIRPLDSDELRQVIALADDPDVEKAITLTVYQRDEDSPAGTKGYNPKTTGFEIEDEAEEAPKATAQKAAAKPAAKPAAEPVQEELDLDDAVEEPTRVAAKPTNTSAAPEKLGNVLAAWDD